MAAVPATSPAPLDAPAAAPPSGLAAKILKQGKPAAHLPASAPVLGKAGRYKVVHGSLTLGYDAATGERVTAHPGAVVSLTAGEAGACAGLGTVEKLDDE